MNQAQKNAFTAHYQRHNVNTALFHAIAAGAARSVLNAIPIDDELNEFKTLLWQHGLCIAPAELLPRPSFSVDELDALNLDGYDRLTSPAKQVLAACINAHQNAVEFDTPKHSFAAEIIEAAQDKRYLIVRGETLVTVLNFLICYGFVEKHHYHYRLSAHLAAVIEQASQPQTEQVA